jgi:hypothetical protein
VCVEPRRIVDLIPRADGRDDRLSDVDDGRNPMAVLKTPNLGRQQVIAEQVGQPPGEVVAAQVVIEHARLIAPMAAMSSFIVRAEPTGFPLSVRTNARLDGPGPRCISTGADV